MAAPTFVAASGVNNGNTANIDTFSWPVPASAQVGDVAVIVTGINSGANVFPTPAGWTKLGADVITGNNHSTQAFAKVLVSGDLGTTINTTLPAAAGKVHGGGFVVRGAAGIPGFAVDTDTTNGATLVGASITTTTVDNFIAEVAMFRNTTATAQTSSTVSTGWTERADTGTANSIIPNFNANIATRNTAQATAGTVTGPTFTSTDTASTGHMWAFAFEPGAAANQTPTVSAGADLANLEPYVQATFGPFIATDPDGTIAFYSVTQTAGTTVTRTSPTVNTRAVTPPGTVAGETLTFSVTVTDNAGAQSPADTVNLGVLPASIRVAVAGQLVPAEIRVPDLPAVVTGGLGYIGDGLVEQDGSGAARQAMLAAGWPTSQLEVDGLNHRTMTLAGVTHPNVGEVIDAWRANGFDPYTWVIDLGSHNAGATDATWTTLAGEVLDKIAAGPRAAYIVNWVGIAFASTPDTRATRFLAVLNALVGTRPKITLRPLDWNSYIHNGRDETGLWADPADTGRYMTAAGYALRNPWVAGQVGTPT